MKKTATYLRNLEVVTADQRVYVLDPPLPKECYACGHIGGVHMVVVSAAVAPNEGMETYIFEANEDGTAIASFSELDGSQRGLLDHERVLRDLGYEVVRLQEEDEQ